MASDFCRSPLEASCSSAVHSAERRFQEAYEAHCTGVSHVMGWILVAQFAIGIGVAILASPHAWNTDGPGAASHVLIAALAGTVTGLVPAVFTRLAPASQITRYAVACGQVGMVALLIHLTRGRIESHFALFVVLAFVAMYRDGTAIALAAAVALTDLVVRSQFAPEGVYGGGTHPLPLLLEHGFFVAVESGVLMWGARRAYREMQSMAAEHDTSQRLAMRLDDQMRTMRTQVDDLELTRSESQRLVRRLEDERAGVESRIQAAVADSDARRQRLHESVRGVLRVASQLASSIHSNASLVEQLAVAAEDNGDIAVRATASMSETVAVMGATVEKVSSAAGRVGQLRDASSEIRAIVALIENIARQTNLLALNAMIEAAHAGKHGSGFAVVASEVHLLARRTTEAVKRIDSIAGQILTVSTEASHAITRGAESLECSVAANGRTQEALNEIAASSRALTSMSTQVAVAVLDQTLQGEAISQQVSQIA